jgi:SAM-dependent methyltransferase
VFSEAPELYDSIYGAFKDYDSEARQIAELLRELAPNAHTVLDVACGTGEHALRLSSVHGFAVAGLDIEPTFVELARAKVPEAEFRTGDMADFELGRQFDVIVCLFSSIGYLTDPERVEAAARSFHRHLTPGGVAVVEPWFSPEGWTPGRVYVHTAEGDAGHVVRMSHSTVEGRISKLEFHYLIGTPEGIEHRIEHHELGLFTTGELTGAFRRAGFTSVRHDPKGLTGRGLLIARREG